jgi:putative nucleotidyltransferase with HDIG domain
MDIISSRNLVNIIRKTLNLIDGRLIHHGERVSYIINKMLMHENLYKKEELLSYTIAALLHDIGAYKNEELDKMVQFETTNVWGHSIYGYLFLKYLSPLNNIAEIVLYHHLDYNKLVKMNSPYEAIAGYLNLADRIDVSLMYHEDIELDKLFTGSTDTKFSKKALDLFERADKEYHIISNLKDNTYLDELNQIFGEVSFSQDEKESFIRMLIYSIDFRSEYTVMHTITTVSIADEIGKLMGLKEYDREILHFGALLHDIGKISTPIDILEAPRKLTEEEMAVMKNHVLASEYILKEYINPDILEIAIRHHEKIDGSGYHRGLTLKDLTVPQRILAVADIVSALCGKRSYKDSFDKETILTILKKDSDKGKLCPDTVECVTMYFDEIMENVNQNTFEPLHIYADMKKKYNVIYEKFLLFT